VTAPTWVAKDGPRGGSRFQNALSIRIAARSRSSVDEALPAYEWLRTLETGTAPTWVRKMDREAVLDFRRRSRSGSPRSAGGLSRRGPVRLCPRSLRGWARPSGLARLVIASLASVSLRDPASRARSSDGIGAAHSAARGPSRESPPAFLGLAIGGVRGVAIPTWCRRWTEPSLLGGGDGPNRRS